MKISSFKQWGQSSRRSYKCHIDEHRRWPRTGIGQTWSRTELSSGTSLEFSLTWSAGSSGSTRPPSTLEPSSSTPGSRRPHTIPSLNSLMGVLPLPSVPLLTKEPTSVRWGWAPMGLESGWCFWLTWRRSSKDSMMTNGRQSARSWSSYLTMRASISRTASRSSSRRGSSWPSPSHSTPLCSILLKGCSQQLKTSSKRTT